MREITVYVNASRLICQDHRRAGSPGGTLTG